MKSTAYFRNNKILIVTVLILVSFAFSNKLKSKAPVIGQINACNNDNSPDANGHYNKHVSNCFAYSKNYSGKPVVCPQITYNGQTVIPKAALDAFGSLVEDGIHVVKFGSKYLNFIFKKRKIISLRRIKR